MHRKPPQNGGDASTAMSEEVPEIPPDKKSAGSEDSEEDKNEMGLHKKYMGLLRKEIFPGTSF